MFGLFKGKQEEASTTGSNTSNHVYIQSKDHAWVPARLLETSGDEAKVSVPNYKDEQSMQSDGGRGARGTTPMTVKLSTYPNKALPLQNVNEDGTLKEHEDMVDLPFLHEVSREELVSLKMLAICTDQLTYTFSLWYRPPSCIT